jgi:CDP-glycerol glycerophosphotransferase (TagB/SpsB family)
MDVACQKKPVVSYQFDRETFRKGHLPAGYFDYARDGFGPVTETVPEALSALKETIGHECRMEPPYGERVDRFFTLRDANASERTTEAIREIIARR